MATATVNTLLTSIRGRLGSAVFYLRGSRQCVRIYVIPREPDTVLQRKVHLTFADAVRSWQELPGHEKDKYRKKAQGLGMSGYNYYISIYISRDTNSKNKQIKAEKKTGIEILSAPLRFRFDI